MDGCNHEFKNRGDLMSRTSQKRLNYREFRGFLGSEMSRADNVPQIQCHETDLAKRYKSKSQKYLMLRSRKIFFFDTRSPQFLLPTTVPSMIFRCDVTICHQTLVFCTFVKWLSNAVVSPRGAGE